MPNFSFIFGIAVCGIACFISIFNIAFIIYEIQKVGLRNRFSLLTLTFSYLIAMLALFSSFFIDVNTKESRLYHQISNTLNAFFFTVSLSGICLLSLIKFDKVLPRAQSKSHLWKMRIIYSLHAIISLTTITIQTYTSITKFYIIGKYTYQMFIMLFFISWCSILELTISFIFLNALLMRRMNLVQTIKTASTTMTPETKIKNLNTMMTVFRVVYGIGLFMVLCYVSGYLILVHFKITTVMLGTLGSSMLASYFTVVCRQKSIITKIFE